MNFKNLDHTDIWVRATKTFLQGFVATLGVSNLADLNLSSGKQLLIAAVAGGVSAAWNYLLAVLVK